MADYGYYGMLAGAINDVTANLTKMYAMNLDARKEERSLGVQEKRLEVEQAQVKGQIVKSEMENQLHMAGLEETMREHDMLQDYREKNLAEVKRAAIEQEAYHNRVAANQEEMTRVHGKNVDSEIKYRAKQGEKVSQEIMEHRELNRIRPVKELLKESLIPEETMKALGIDVNGNSSRAKIADAVLLYKTVSAQHPAILAGMQLQNLKEAYTGIEKQVIALDPKSKTYAADRKKLTAQGKAVQKQLMFANGVMTAVKTGSNPAIKEIAKGMMEDGQMKGIDPEITAQKVGKFVASASEWTSLVRASAFDMDRTANESAALKNIGIYDDPNTLKDKLSMSMKGTPQEKQAAEDKATLLRFSGKPLEAFQVLGLKVPEPQKAVPVSTGASSTGGITPVAGRVRSKSAMGFAWGIDPAEQLNRLSLDNKAGLVQDFPGKKAQLEADMEAEKRAGY